MKWPSEMAKKKRKKDASKKPPKVKAAPKKQAPPRPVSTRGACRFVCSECYAEFMLPGSFSQDALTCPECLHVGKRPDEDFLRTVLIHKGQERNILTLTSAAGGGFVLAALLLIWQAAPHAHGSAELIPTSILRWGVGILLLALLVLVYRFEKSRWEVYF